MTATVFLPKLAGKGWERAIRRNPGLTGSAAVLPTSSARPIRSAAIELASPAMAANQLYGGLQHAR
ncbi:MAG: hypothetical protein LBF34_05140 [Puniceicoccales bacterium]|nr:hypothetical protein [Puniceicoccales bacterium]